MQEIDLIFQQYYRPLCLYATHYLHDIDEAEDMVQDCFVKLISRSIMPENIKAFLYTSVRNACIDRMRRQSPIDTEINPTDLCGVISDDQA
ncbi:sigma factor [Prevotella sp. AM34-19LB]|jgi:RNA polymerase sigma factor (sigma-70 family)|uniref:sigma factor n=1 Tax=Prevotellaceae TaxID=171552 RepID=UPI0026824773